MKLYWQTLTILVVLSGISLVPLVSYSETTDEEVSEEVPTSPPQQAVCLLNPSENASASSQAPEKPIRKRPDRNRRRARAKRKIKRVLQASLSEDNITSMLGKPSVNDEDMAKLYYDLHQSLRQNYPDEYKILGEARVLEIMRGEMKQARDRVRTAKQPGYEYTPNDESPFSWACQKTNTREGRPTTGLWKSQIPARDANGNKTTDFIFGVISQALHYAQENLNLSHNIQRCLQPGQTDARCDAMKNWADKEFPRRVNEARLHLGMSGHTSSRRGVDTEPNKSLRVPWTSYKEKKWQPQTPQETEKTRAVLSGYRDKVAQNCQWPTRGHSQAQRKFIDRQVNFLRAQHFTTYNSIISDLPLMQYITTNNPTHADISQAAAEFQKNGQKEYESLEKFAKAILEKGDEALKEPGIAGILDYQGFVEGYLLANPQYCGVATSLAYTRDNRQMRRIAITTPIMLAAFAAGPIGAGVAAVAGATAGSVATGAVLAGSLATSVGTTIQFANEAQADFDASRRRQLSEVFNEVILSGADDLAAKEKQIYKEWAYLPLEFVGVGISGGARRLFRLRGNGSASQLVKTAYTGTRSTGRAVSRGLRKLYGSRKLTD